MGCCQNKKIVRIERYISHLKQIVSSYQDPFYNWSILTLLHSSAKEELELLKKSVKTEKEGEDYEELYTKHQEFKKKYSSYKREFKIVH